MIDELLAARLADAGGSFGTKIYPLQAPEGTAAPYCVFFRADIEPRHTHDGPVYLRRHTFQVSCFAESYKGARDDIEAVRLALDGWRSDDVSACLLVDERFAFESDTRIYHASQDYAIDHDASQFIPN